MKLTYCVECAAPLHKQTATKYTCPNGHFFWNNPKAAVGILLVKNTKVLLARRAINPQKGKLDVPGGFLDYDETPRDAMRRELLEETGLTVDAMDLLDVVTNEYEENTSTCPTIFVATTWQGTPNPKDDVSALEWHEYTMIDSPEFAWKLPTLTAKIKAYLEQS